MGTPVGSVSKIKMKARWMICVLAALWMAAMIAHAWQQDTFAIAGVVHDGAGQGAAGASVRLQAQGDGRGQEVKTDEAGKFGFAGLKAGTYVVSARKGDAHSNEVTVRGTGGGVQRVELLFASGANVKAEEMEFSDVPNFTVAGVTDWTAAGGHGSDTTLRASESLTRETLQLKAEPKSGSARADASGTERQLREAVAKSPRDYAANEELGRFYLREERYGEAVVPLQTAFEAGPTQKQAECELALALVRSGDAAKSRGHVDRLLTEGDRAEWHRLAGEVDEKLGDALGAVREFERAVKEDPSEENYFAWGTELLEHRAIWQAKDVFESGVKAYPKSARMLTALGTALFSGAMYEDAAQRLCEASDLSPGEAAPYLFMGRVDLASPDPLPCVETKLKRFVELQPGNALAHYYYAMAYWKQNGKRTDAETLGQVEQSLRKAVEADTKCSLAYLELGVIRASQSDYRGAAALYQKAIDADSLSTEAHYRLGVAYDRLGDKEKATEEFRIHDELKKQQAAAVEKQRREVKQFLVQVGGDDRNKAAQP